MKFFILACLAVASSAVELMKVEEPIQDEYIILFKSNVSEHLRASHMDEIDGKIIFKYDFPGFQGYSAVMQPDYLSQVLESPLVKHVEQNGEVHLVEEDLGPNGAPLPEACVTQTGATWGIVRTCTENLELHGQYKYEESAGWNINTYVVDTGIMISHNDFSGRAVWGANFVDNTNTDGNGHGTHVASTMVGVTYGLAKAAGVKAVKVLNAAGSGSMSGVIAGVDWVANDAIAIWNKAKTALKRATKAIGNMSLGGARSTALNAAVDAAYANDVLFANAAGNNGNTACNYSPASAEEGISVGATSNSDALASFSNWGTCVDILAPGVSITAAWIGSNSATNTISGTSMAAPHVAGVVAKLMMDHPTFDAEKIKAELLGSATEGKISGVRGSPNLLAYHGCIDA